MPHATSVRLRTIVGSVLVLACAPGCTHVIRRPAPFYTADPYSSAQPKGWLTAGSYVLWLGPKGAYTRVLADRGVGFVDQRDLTGVLNWWIEQSKARSRGKDKKHPVMFQPSPPKKKKPPRPKRDRAKKPKSDSPT